ncbi:hypothetical protein QWY87_11685 [Lutimonas halocynthiae]|uniref:hypothetical protein n=1 Tax=Lutimonas halocynthiae TaxID=1446477 RepID=UPI0025B5C429|nr:hypothetical protein [Lutimonas halocynthiae]MDN3643366.1 hypothetical protein [Lutimonas halocynthiae]
MKTIVISLLIIFSLISCKEKPTFCENPYQVKEIKLVPTEIGTVGREITIKNDSLINFITKQICDVTDVQWSTGTRGEGERVEIQFFPNPTNKKIFIVHRSLDYNDYRFREGTAYFRNDLLCELVFKLTGIENKGRNKINEENK